MLIVFLRYYRKRYNKSVKRSDLLKSWPMVKILKQTMPEQTSRWYKKGMILNSYISNNSSICWVGWRRILLHFKSGQMNCKNHFDRRHLSTRKSLKSRESQRSRNCNRGIDLIIWCKISSTNRRSEMNELSVCKIVLRRRRKLFRKG